MNKLYSWLASQFLGKILGDKKTNILGWTLSAIGAVEVLASTGNLQSLCENANICLQGNTILGSVLGVLGQVAIILRYATGQSYGDPKFIKHR